MIEAHGLTRRYGPFTAVHDVSFTVADGEIVGMLGPNGAGKTTTLRMITGFLPPSAGRVTVAGHDLLSEPKKARRELGYLPENVALYGEMRVREYLGYRAQLEGMKRADARQAIENAVRRCLLEEVERQIIGTLSKGYRQRVGLAAAILHGPRVLVLDEPTVGLDPKQIIAIRELIRELGQERTLLLSTHILPEVEQLCHRVFIVDRGRLVAEGTPQELRDQAQGHAVLQVTLKDAPADAADVLGGVDGVAAVRAEPANGETRLALECRQGVDLREAVFRAAVAKGWTLLGLREEKASLEDVFVRLTAQDGAPAVPPEDALAAAEPEAKRDEDEDEDEPRKDDEGVTP
jgi:ABC-2 type transport system ATP-binding protein